MTPIPEFTVPAQTHALAARLANIKTFAGLNEEDLLWLASLMVEHTLQPGDVLVKEGSPADQMVVLIEGELQGRRESVPDAPTYLVEAGEVTGMLPFSRLKEIPVTVRASAPSYLATLATMHFDVVLRRLPELGPRLVGVMSDRIREVAREDLQRDKLVALGKLSAGLAHELNNPAAAVLRAVDAVRTLAAEWQEANIRLESRGLTQEQRKLLRDCERECVADMNNMPVLDSLAQSDREEKLAALLAESGVKEPWKLSPTLVEGGFEPEDLACIAEAFPGAAMADVLTRFACTLAIERLLSEASLGARRISELVQSMKDYTFMDQAPWQEVDLHRGIESTLTILHHRLQAGIQVVKKYDDSVPPIPAHGSELNQVWTNLIENALDAVGSEGQIQIRTQREANRVLVEITDNGPGIPAGIQERVFEPFFTTKDPGKGVGLGLDIVFRTVRKHHGEVRFESRPGCTRFQVRLPISGGATASARL